MIGKPSCAPLTDYGIPITSHKADILEILLDAYVQVVTVDPIAP